MLPLLVTSGCAQKINARLQRGAGRIKVDACKCVFLWKGRERLGPRAHFVFERRGVALAVVIAAQRAVLYKLRQRHARQLQVKRCNIAIRRV